MPTEADTCRLFVVPKLQASGWDTDPHSIAEQRQITDGRIIPKGTGYVRRPPKRVDYLLRYTRDFPLAVVEAKAKHKTAADGLQQAKLYAEMLGLKFAYATNGKQLRVVKLTDYTAEKVRSLCANPEELRKRRADPEQRAEVIDELQERGIDFQTLALQAGKPDADPFDLLCHLAFNAPLLTRSQRAERVKREEGAFFGQFGAEAREILAELLEKYAEDGELQFTLPDVLKVAPVSSHGNVAEIAAKFGGAHDLLNAIKKLQKLLYVA
jgi:type I site-specific restriction endonuclease